MTIEPASSTPPLPTRSEPIRALLEGRYVDPESGKPVSLETRSLEAAATLAGSEADLIASLDLGARLAVVGDVRTFAVLGDRVTRALQGRFNVEAVVLPGLPYPDDATVRVVRDATTSADALIAVGSGTVNDLTKYASAIDGKPYAVFATAPSMNGYTSLTASISQQGHKLTLPAQAPRGAFFDLEVLANAPVRMIRAGLGDSVCRATAQTDWLLSHLLLGTPYRQLPFDLVADEEPALLDLTADLVKGSLEAMQVLVRTLILSGLGTAIVGSSAPASQGEHLVSHYLDMLAPPRRPHVFHGEQVGVTTLSLARLQENLLERPPVLQPDTLTEGEVIAHFGEELGRSVWPEFAAKRLDAAKTDALNHRIATGWTDIAARLALTALPATRIEAVLRKAGAPVTPEAIHVDRPLYETALLRAREIRDRYTTLDVLAASRRLPALLPMV